MSKHFLLDSSVVGARIPGLVTLKPNSNGGFKENGMLDISKVFGSNVFNEKAMKERLPNDTYKALLKTIEQGAPLTLNVANVVANAMKDWAIEKGATHYTHWFQPLTGTTAEKHDSFISPTSDGGVIM